MSDDKNGAAQKVAAPGMKIINQYIRDMSFENIAAQKNLGGDLKPEVNVQVNLDANKKNETGYEVALKLNVNAKSGDQPVFVLEIDYAGLFTIENVPDLSLIHI